MDQQMAVVATHSFVGMEADDAARILRILLRGPVTAEEYITVLGPRLKASPWLLDYDILIDGTEYSGSIGHEAMHGLMQSLAPMLSVMQRRRHVFLCQPRAGWPLGFKLYLPLLERDFPTHHFHYATDMAEAAALLARARQENPAPPVLNPGDALPSAPPGR